tara:strand:- start:291 stop:641 length:351 start_codon:yes stop_codon:yes gene_type:complete
LCAAAFIGLQKTNNTFFKPLRIIEKLTPRSTARSPALPAQHGAQKRRIKGLTRPIFKGRLLLFALPVRNSGVGKLPQFDIFCLLAFWPAAKMPISIVSGGLLPAKVTAKAVSAVLR